MLKLHNDSYVGVYPNGRPVCITPRRVLKEMSKIATLEFDSELWKLPADERRACHESVLDLSYWLDKMPAKVRGDLMVPKENQCVVPRPCSE